MSKEYADDTLAKLHALRRLDPYNMTLYWALTIALDFLLHAGQESVDEDIERVKRAYAQEVKP
jgi:hypothetical protein